MATWQKILSRRCGVREVSELDATKEKLKPLVVQTVDKYGGDAMATCANFEETA